MGFVLMIGNQYFMIIFNFTEEVFPLKNSVRFPHVNYPK